jgi:hypothetical protein
LFYQSTKTNHKTLLHPYTSFVHSNKQNTKPIAAINSKQAPAISQFFSEISNKYVPET